MPASTRRRVTPAQLPASANAPCTSTTVGGESGIACSLQITLRVDREQFGASSVLPCSPEASTLLHARGGLGAARRRQHAPGGVAVDGAEARGRAHARELRGVEA